MQPSTDPFRPREIWPPGTLIKGDYEIRNKLGGGGFGTVYLAQHRFLGTMHVIKRLHEHFASDPEYVRKFVNEARAVRRLKGCPNVVEVEHMTQSEDGHLILVMEHIAGGDLAGLMASRQVRVGEVIEYARQIASGLQAAHAAGLVHRDIKPQNVMLSQDSTGRTILKLIDFGIAADHLGNEQTSVMRGGSIGFAAPEQWVKAGKELDGRTDLYSLGASMYRMLCGRMPFESNDIGDWIEQVKKTAPVAPSRVRKDVPKALSDLILDLLSFRLEDRPADAGVVIQRLEDIKWDGEPSVTLEKTIRTESGQLPRPMWPIWASAAGLLAALSVGGWLVMGIKSPTMPAIQNSIEQPVKTVRAGEPETKPKPPSETLPKASSPETPQKPDDHAQLGDAALNAGDYRIALNHFKRLNDKGRLATLQGAVESDVDERVSGLLDLGKQTEAVRMVEPWLKEFPNSQRLQTLRMKINQTKDAR